MVYFGVLTKEEKKVRTLGALASVFARMIRITSMRDVVTTVVEDDSKPYAAWTVQDSDGPDVVTFNSKHIGNLDTASDIVRVTGLAHHERCHVMFTPVIRDSEKHPIGRVFRKYKDQAYHCFNILEDQRIESFDVAQRRAARHYYAAMISGYILSGTEDEQKLAWILVHGRRYLGQQIRDTLEAMFKYPQHIPEIKRIIDEYRVLNLLSHGDQYIAARLIEELRNLLYDTMPEQPAYGHHAEPCVVAASVKGAGRGSDKEGSAKAAAKVRAGVDDGGEEFDKDKGEDAEDENEGEDGDDWEDWEGDGEDGDEDGDGTGESKSNSKSGGGQGAGEDGTGDKGDGTEIQELLANAIAVAVTSEVVRAETQRSQEALKRTEHTDTIGGHRGWVNDNRPDTQVAARTLSRRLERMKTDLDPGWVTHKNTGRVNIRRMATRNPNYDEAFDQWDEGSTEASDIETVLLGDVSGSMSSYVRQLADAMWSIKAGHDKIGASCTVYAFDSRGYIVWGAKEKAKPGVFPHVPATGGTNPKRVLIESARILDSSQRKRKMFIVMTDGVWTDSGRVYNYETRQYDRVAGPKNDDIIAEMNGHGVLTAMVFLTGAYDVHGDTIDWHNTQIHQPMQDLKKFAEFGDSLVRRILARR